MITIIITLVCFVAAAYFKAHMDAIDDSGIKSSEWKNKYQLDKWYNPVSVESKNHWWYFGLYKPSYAEKFPFSSTSLVFLTDRWHAYQMMTYRFMYLGASFGVTNKLWIVILLSFIVFPIVVGVVFEIFYGNAKKYYQNSNTKSTFKKTKELKNINEDSLDYFEHPSYEQETSVPEKQIEDIEQ
jgi:hypothetical protein